MYSIGSLFRGVKGLGVNAMNNKFLLYFSYLLAPVLTFLILTNKVVDVNFCFNDNVEHFLFMGLLMFSYFWVWLGLVFCKLISLRVKMFDRGVDYGRFKRL